MTHFGKICLLRLKLQLRPIVPSKWHVAIYIDPDYSEPIPHESIFIRKEKNGWCYS